MRILLFSFVIGNPDRSVKPDTATYVNPAIEIITHAWKYPPEEFSRTPVYPYFIALLYWLFGKDNRVVIFTQIILDCISILLVYTIGLQLFNKITALLAGVLAAVGVDLITQSMFVLTETLFTLLLLSSLVSLTMGLKKGKHYWFLLSAFFLGVSILCRPMAVYFPLISGLIIIAFLRKQRRENILAVILHVSLIFIILCPWLIRNVNLLGNPTISTISSKYLYYYSAASVEAHLRNVSEESVRLDMSARVDQYLQVVGWEKTPLTVMLAENAMAKEILFSHPLIFLGLHIKSDLNSLLPNVTDLTEILGVTVGERGTASVLNQYGLWSAVKYYFGDRIWLVGLLSPLIIFLGLIYLGDIISLVGLLKRKKHMTIFLLCLPVLYFIGLPGAPSLPRFRVPVMPYLYLLAADGICLMFSYLKDQIHSNHRGAV
jgi:4-amino-4-deoxy-L-arabinose transferase-like glycosyltransferase